MSEPRTPDDTDSTRPSARRKSRRFFGPVRLLVFGLLVLLAVPVGLYLARGTAPVRAGILALVNRLDIDGLGRIRASDLSGDPLGNFRLREMAFRDAKGTWASARDLELDWNPAALFKGRIAIRALSAGEIRVLRAPPARAKPPGKGSGNPIEIGALRIGQLNLAPEFAGIGARFSVEGRFSRVPGAAPRIALDVKRLDGGDLLTATLGPGGGGSGEIELGAEMTSPRQGFFAQLLGVDAPLRFELSGRGAEKGSFSGSLIVDGARRVADLAGQWNREVLSADLRFEPETLSSRYAFLSRLGPWLKIHAEAALPRASPKYARQKNVNHRPVTVSVTTRHAELMLAGTWDWRKSVFVMPASLRARLAGGSAIDLKLPFTFRSARFDGHLATGAERRISGTFALERPEVKSAGRPLFAANLGGTVDWPLAGGRFSLGARSDSTSQFLRTTVDGTWQPGRVPTFTFSRSELAHAAGKVSFTGEYSGTGGAFDGEIRVPDLGKLPGTLPDLKGQAEARFTANATSSGPWRIMLRGKSAGFSSSEATLASALGVAPGFTVDASFDPQKGLFLERAALAGKNLRIGATGRVEPGRRMDLRIEAALRGPFPLAGLEAQGEAFVFATLRGPWAAPAWQASAEARQLRIGGVGLMEPRVDIRPIANGAGRMQIAARAASADGPVNVSGRLYPFAGGVRAEDLVLNYGPLAAKGDFAWDPQAGGASGALTLSGSLPRIGGEAGGNLRLSPDTRSVRKGGAKAGGGIDARFSLRNAALPGQMVERLTLSAKGDISALHIKGAVRSRGFLPIAFGFSGPASLREGFTFRPGLEGNIGEEELRSAEPLDIRSGESGQTLFARIHAAGGEILLRANAQGSMFKGEVSGTNLSAAMFGRTLGGPKRQGRIDVSATLSRPESATRASGRAEIRASGLGFAGTRNAGANLTANAVLSDNQLTLKGTTSGLDGLNAEGSARIDRVFSEGAGFSLRPDAMIRAQVTANGSIATAWRLLGPRNQRLTGFLTTALTLGGQVANPDLAGTLHLANGEFEDRLIGLRLRALAMEGRFDQNSLLIETLTAKDKATGDLQATGRVDFAGRSPSLLLRAKLRRFQIADRRLVSAEISGEPVLSLGPDGNLLSGRLAIDRAAFDFSAGSAETPPAAISVRHVNAPGRRENAVAPAGEVFGDRLRLDLAIQAGERLSARGGNFETQWRGDLRLHGDAGSPLVEGQLNLLRGSLDLLGRRFAFVPDGNVQFSGAPEKARLTLAASRNANGFEAIVRVSGEATAPKFRLSSNPALPEDEILARILFGRPLNELGPAEGAQLAAGAATLAAGRALSTGKLFGLRTGLDIGFTPGSAGPRITGGRRLGDRAYVQVTGGPGAQPEIEVEWRARRNLTLVSRFGAEGDSGLALRWRKDY